MDRRTFAILCHLLQTISGLSSTEIIDVEEMVAMIAEWPALALANDNHVRTKFFRILRKMPELTSLDRALLQRHLLSRMDDLRGFVLMPEDERERFFRVLLRDITR
ncbi:retrotransposon protein [Cucumis melo var. makuwa]|uniref:Retrotransposon protein n=1 Tax=Cucumis melo var. makuwa TaxID=1194695 RepID=A0A5D3CYV8_CUCMM|nr:retrotransposon protein [Cucumis melo var. makuwa]